jgi:hypothetical protein
MSSTEQVQSTSKYSAKWQERFAFFDANGAPKEKSFNAAYKALPWKKKFRVHMNLIAFFFGPIYLFVLGLWKKNLALLGIMLLTYAVVIVIFAFLEMETPRPVANGLSLAFSLMYGLATNYAYYLKEVKGEQGWNPFKGFRIV